MEKKFTCNICQEIFSRKQCLNQHILTHKDSGGNSVNNDDRSCEQLIKVSQENTLTNVNCVRENVSEINLILCTSCPSGFQTQEELDEHSCRQDSETRGVKSNEDIDSHAAKNKYECSICCNKFYSYYNWRYHACPKTKFLCDICKKGFLTKESLNKHPCYLTGQKLLVCDFCHEGFTTELNLNFHVCGKKLLEDSDKNPRSYRARKPFVCNVCHKNFSRQESLNTHICERVHRCHMCLEDFFTEENLKIHLCSHANELICDSYQEIFANEQNGKQLEDSNENPHSPPVPKTVAENKRDENFTNPQSLSTTLACQKHYRCHMCLIEFLAEENLYAHLRTHVKELECDFYQSESSSKENLNHQHQIVSDVGEKTYTCPTSFSAQEELDLHRSVHSVNKKFTCSLCPRSFSTMQLLDKHFNFHTSNRSFVCNVCQKQFSKKEHFVAHVRTHKGQRHITLHIKNETTTDLNAERPLLSCNRCQEKFHRKKDLNEHNLRNTCQSLFVCDVCKKEFSTKDMLETHTNVHTGQKCQTTLLSKCKFIKFITKSTTENPV